MMVTTEQDRERVKQYLKQATSSAEIITQEQAHARDILNTLKADYDIPPAISRKIITAMRKGNAVEVKEANDMFADLIEITGV